MIKDITDSIKQTYNPCGAIIIYEAESYNCENRYYIESRPIKKDGTLGVAKPVSKSFIQGIAKTFKSEEEMQPHGPMPANFLFADSRIGQEVYIWWTPPAQKSLHFTEGIAIKEGTYWMPGCVWVAKKDRLSVYCYAGKKPTLKTKLLYGPFFNYYDDAGICLGNAHVEWPDDITWKDIQQHWEKLFWGSINSHTICNPMKEKQSLVLAIKDAAEKPFNTALLKEKKMNLETLLKNKGETWNGK